MSKLPEYTGDELIYIKKAHHHKQCTFLYGNSTKKVPLIPVNMQAVKLLLAVLIGGISLCKSFIFSTVFFKHIVGLLFTVYDQFFGIKGKIMQRFFIG